MKVRVRDADWVRIKVRVRIMVKVRMSVRVRVMEVFNKDIVGAKQELKQISQELSI